MGIGFVIKRLRMAKGMSQRELAKKAGLAQPSVSYIESRDPMKSEFLPQIAEVLGVDVETILNKANSGEEVIIGEGENAKPVDFLRIAEYAISCSAGGGNGDHPDCELEAVADVMPRSYPITFFQDHRINPDNCKIFRVDGDSMEPLLYDGDRVMADTLQQSRIRDGAVYVICYQNELYVKRLMRGPNGVITIRSDNELYNPITVLPEEQDSQFRIIGKVVDRFGNGGLG